MSVRVELWIDGRLLGGTELWWDDVEAVLPAAEDVQMLYRVDPYGDEVFTQDELETLAAEVQRVLSATPERVRPFLLKVAELCAEGSTGAEAELRFLGD